MTSCHKSIHSVENQPVITTTKFGSNRYFGYWEDEFNQFLIISVREISVVMTIKQKKKKKKKADRHNFSYYIY